MVDIIHRVGIKAPIDNVYTAISTIEGIASWWTREISTAPDREDSFIVRFLNTNGELLGSMNIDVMKREPRQEVHWRVTSGPNEWIGTDVTFELKQDGEYTIVLFGHRHWQEAVEFMSHCSMKWAIFLLSLKGVLETGRGTPSPNDFKIDNWN
jgi:uncharacterized protein YndB with AHSA1/START domain